MKTKTKKLLSLLFVVVFAFSAIPLGELSEYINDIDLSFLVQKASAADYEYIQYGNYPQSSVTDIATVAALNAVAGSTDSWNSYGYYSGTASWYDRSWDDGNMTAGDYMKYKDVVYGGAKYRGVYFTAYRPEDTGSTPSESYTFQVDNGYNINTVYWFRFEPLVWRVLDASTGLVMCENIIDSQAYNNYLLRGDVEYYGDAAKTYHANNYYYSSIRKWLNETFYDTAFNDSQKNNIEITHLNNNRYSSSLDPEYNMPESDDKIFLLSYAEVRNTAYGFASDYSTYDTARRAKGTDYAECQGLYQSDGYNGGTFWWLRSPDGGSLNAFGIRSDGYADNKYYVSYTYIGVRPACKLTHLKSDISQSDITSSNSSSVISASINSIKIIPREAEASLKLNGANIAYKDINLTLENVTAEVGGKIFTQNSDKIIEIPTKDVTGDITVKKSGYYDYVIPREVYNSFTTASLDNILDYDAYMTKSHNDGRVYISSAFGRVGGSGDSYVDLTHHSLKLTSDACYDFYITALNKSSSASYCITQDDAHKISPKSTGKFTSGDIGSLLVNGKTVYVYVTSGGKRSELVPLKLDIEQGGDNAFIKNLKKGTLSLGGDSGISIKVPENWILIGGSELNIADFNFPVGVEITGNKVKVSVGFDLWSNVITENISKCAVDNGNGEKIDGSTYITEKKSGVINDGLWKTVKDGLKDAEWSWKNAKTKAERDRIKRNLSDRYGVSYNDLASNHQKTSGFDVSALGYIEGEIVNGKFVVTEFMISVSGSFTISYTQQFTVGYIGIEGGGNVTVSFAVERGIADRYVDFNLKTGVDLAPFITPRAGLGINGVASIGVYGKATIPMGLIFSVNDKALTGSVQINGEIGYEAQLLCFKTGKQPLVSGTVGPWSHTWRFGAKSSPRYVAAQFADTADEQTVGERIMLEPIARNAPSAWLSGTKRKLMKSNGNLTSTGITVTNLQTDVFSNSGTEIITCGDTTLAVWADDDTQRDDYNRLKLVYSVYDSTAALWSEPKAVYDDGCMDSAPSLATDGSSIYVAWQKLNKILNANNSAEVADVLGSTEIYLARYDAVNDGFVSVSRLTDNDSYDYLPSVVVKNGVPTVFYATDCANALVSADSNTLSKYSGDNTTVIQSNLATVNGIESTLADNEIQLAYSVDSDGNIETTNDITVFYGSNMFSAVPMPSDNATNAIGNFTYVDIGGETKLIYSDGFNIYYIDNGMAKPILENGMTVSGKLSAVSAGNSANIFWLSSTESGNELYTASYDNGKWSDAVALTDRGNELSNVALTYANNTLLGVANETLVSYDDEAGTYSKGETNFIFIKVNDFCDITVKDIDILQYDKDAGQTTGISLTVTDNGNLPLEKVYFDITDTNGYEKTYYIETALLPGQSEECRLPYDIPLNFQETTVTVRAYSDIYEDINEDDNTVNYEANKSDIMVSNLPTTYFKDGCILSSEIVNYNFADAENVQTYIRFEENGEKISENYIGEINQNSKATVEFAYAFDELPFDENGLALVYMTVTADNAEPSTVTFVVEDCKNQCAHPVTEELERIEPTCTKPGHAPGVICLGCGEYVSGGEDMPATGHTTVADNAVVPTCTQTGLTAGIHCAVCETVLTEQEEVAALGHNFSTSEITTKPDCAQNGIRTYYCSRCDETKTEVIPKIEHTDMDENAICDICGNSISDILPGETKSVTIIGGSLTYLKFVPMVSGSYSFASDSSSDTCGYLYNSDNSQINFDDDGGEGNNFKITYDLIRGQTYYFGCRYYNGLSSGSYNVTLTLDSVLETLSAAANTDTVIDTAEGFIYLSAQFVCNPFDYFTVKSGYNCECEAALKINGKELYGTGSKITVKSGEIPVAKYTIAVWGDLDGDSVCDVLDAALCERALSGHITLSGAYKAAADSNTDTEITAADYSDVVNRALA